MPAFDAASSGSSVGVPLSIPHTVGLGDAPVLISAIFIKREDSPGIVSAAAFDGASMTKHAEYDEGGIFRLYLYKLAAPTQGAVKNLVITGTPLDYISAINISALDANQVDILGTAVSARGDSALFSLVTIVDGLADGLLLDNHIVLSGNDPAPDADQAERGEENFEPASARQNVSTKAGADGGGMGWSWITPATWFMLAAAIKAGPFRQKQAITLKEV